MDVPSGVVKRNKVFWLNDNVIQKFSNTCKLSCHLLLNTHPKDLLIFLHIFLFPVFVSFSLWCLYIKFQNSQRYILQNETILNIHFIKSAPAEFFAFLFLLFELVLGKFCIMQKNMTHLSLTLVTPNEILIIFTIKYHVSSRII